MATAKKHKTRIEAKCALWLARHPAALAAPAAISTSVLELGAVTTGGIAAGVVATGLGWYRAHPASFTTHAAPRIRSARRRWTRYHGRPWRTTLDACNLVTEDRRTGELHVPRIVKLSSPTPSIDVVRVRLCKGQSLRTFQDVQEELASALGADVLGIVKTSPRLLTLTLVHGNPFDDIVPPAEIPDEADDVDLTALELGDTEYGQSWTEPLIGQHWLIAGATGSGKGSLLWNPLRAMGPMIRDQLVKVWMIDPKGGMETELGRPLFHRYATSADEPVEDEDGDDQDPMLALLVEFRDEMKARQEVLRDRKQRKFTVAPDTPFHVLMIDELAMLTALGGSRATVTAVNKILAEILTQGRAAGFAVIAYVQEPTKDIVPVRDLFTRRIALRLGSSGYVDIVLGDDARLRGALADEIPETDHEGIGYRTSEKSRNPIRVRAGHTTDDDITELVRQCTPHQVPDDGSNVYAIHAA
ncbi:MAG: ftsK [Amycolatopsis sp.]|uniref:type IV secretory system conjugative DNA transfer family protein n=1 Tax=Amycolatopsis sp. TaxID=37632 RepID=UPI00261F6E0B|nr:FtsK/SpoIIIE domain-containing protein [Amycolatopsis sp.]MCU1685331.1 ftsK [Amycolatopsis sp.]